LADDCKPIALASDAGPVPLAVPTRAARKHILALVVFGLLNNHHRADSRSVHAKLRADIAKPPRGKYETPQSDL
jgi:hypothetical protein